MWKWFSKRVVGLALSSSNKTLTTILNLMIELTQKKGLLYSSFKLRQLKVLGREVFWIQQPSFFWLMVFSHSTSYNKF